MSQPVRVMPGDAPRSGGNSCLIGCLVTTVVGVVLAVVLVAVAFYAVGQLRDKLTSTTPVPLPATEYAPEEAERVRQQMAAFEAALKSETPVPAQIELTAHELNVLLQTDPRFSLLADKIYLDINDATLSARVSVPLDQFPGMQGRWLNGAAALDVDVVNNRFVVSIEQFTVQGATFPGQALSQFEGELNNGLNQDPDVRALAERIQDISVQDGRVRITLEGGQP